MAKLVALPLYDSRESAYVNPEHGTQITPVGSYTYGSGAGSCSVKTIDGKSLHVSLDAGETRNRLLKE